MARVRALFVSWVCTSLIVSITLTAAACGAPGEDVAGPTLGTPSAPPTRTAQADYTPAARPPDGQRASASATPATAPTGATEQANDPPPSATPPAGATEQANDPPPSATPATPPTGATEQANDPPPSATPATAPAGATEQANDPPPSATPATAPAGATEQANDPPPSATPSTAPTGATEQANDPPPSATPATAPTGATEQANDPPPSATPSTPPPTAGDDLTASPRRPSSQLRQSPDSESESPSDWTRLDDVSRSAQGAEYTWQDGRHTRRARVQVDLVAQAEEETRSDDIVVRGGGEEHVVRRQPRHDETALPVFRSESGEILTLPGGVLLALDASWDQARVDQFFLENGITSDRIARQQFAVHAFLVETEPGFPSLELAKTLATQDGVLLSSPNWRREETTR